MPYKSVAARKKYHKVWYEEHGDVQRNQMKERNSRLGPAYRRTEKGRFFNLRARAKRRGLEMTLSFEDYVAFISESCHYCQGTLPEAGCGLDRVDSSRGYIKDNVRPCCETCNRAKGDLTEEKFMEWVGRIYEASLGKVSGQSIKPNRWEAPSIPNAGNNIGTENA